MASGPATAADGTVLSAAGFEGNPRLRGRGCASLFADRKEAGRDGASKQVSKWRLIWLASTSLIQIGQVTVGAQLFGGTVPGLGSLARGCRRSGLVLDPWPIRRFLRRGVDPGLPPGWLSPLGGA